ncbi:hypothetical protein MLD38_003427 [Melastoma candidum]|nr:hypothetical protein MLD38_003427 [Melastoma candidum]
MDDYSWLDGYRVPPPVMNPVLDSIWSSSTAVYQNVGSTAGTTAAVNFPSHVLHYQNDHFPAMEQNGWQDPNIFDSLKEQQLPQLSSAFNQSHKFAPIANQYNGSSWAGQYFE